LHKMRGKRNRSRFSRLGLLPIALLLALCLTGVGYGMWSDEVYIEGTITTGEWDCGGTVGYWMNWDNHYTEAEMLPWLVAINSSSEWLGPTTVAGLDDLFAATGQCPPPTMKSKFLAHYMATRLDIASGRLDTGNTHDITGIAGYAYLGLPNPALATLSEIIIAIEGKYPAEPEDPEAVWPTDNQYETMKDICDALNNLWI